MNLEEMSPEQRNFFPRSSGWRRNISRDSRVVAVRFYQLIPLGSVLICRLVSEGELGYGWHNNIKVVEKRKTRNIKMDNPFLFLLFRSYYPTLTT